MTPDGHSGMKKKPTMSWTRRFMNLSILRNPADQSITMQEKDLLRAASPTPRLADVSESG